MTLLQTIDALFTLSLFEHGVVVVAVATVAIVGIREGGIIAYGLNNIGRASILLVATCCWKQKERQLKRNGVQRAKQLNDFDC